MNLSCLRYKDITNTHRSDTDAKNAMKGQNIMTKICSLLVDESG